MATVKSFKAEVSSVSPSLGWMEELWVVRMLICRNAAKPLLGIRWQECENELVEWKSLVDIVGIKSAELKINFRSGVLTIFFK